MNFSRIYSDTNRFKSAHEIGDVIFVVGGNSSSDEEYVAGIVEYKNYNGFGFWYYRIRELDGTLHGFSSQMRSTYIREIQLGVVISTLMNL